MRLKRFCSCSPCEISKFQMNGDKANAHAGMPFLRYVSVCLISFLLIVGCKDQGQQPISGRGSFAFIVHWALLSLTWINASTRAFL